MSIPVLYLVVPCYNEEEVLADTADKLERKLRQLIDAGKIAARSRIAFVNDGSSFADVRSAARSFRGSTSHTTRDIKMRCSQDS